MIHMVIIYTLYHLYFMYGYSITWFSKPNTYHNNYIITSNDYGIADIQQLTYYDIFKKTKYLLYCALNKIYTHILKYVIYVMEVVQTFGFFGRFHGYCPCHVTPHPRDRLHQSHSGLTKI